MPTNDTPFLAQLYGVTIRKCIILDSNVSQNIKEKCLFIHFVMRGFYNLALMNSDGSGTQN